MASSNHRDDFVVIQTIFPPDWAVADNLCTESLRSTIITCSRLKLKKLEPLEIGIFLQCQFMEFLPSILQR